jgi:uncharacterized membrane protein SirB2
MKLRHLLEAMFLLVLVVAVSVALPAQPKGKWLLVKLAIILPTVMAFSFLMNKRRERIIEEGKRIKKELKELQDNQPPIYFHYK